MERLTIENGLSQGMIFDMLQTRDGFMWIATKDGLNRYDGYHFKVFSNDPFDPYSIAASSVTSLFEDSKGRLWVSTQANGLDLYDAATQRFYHLKYKAGQTQGLSDNAVAGILEDPSGTIWAVTEKQFLNRFTMGDALPDGPELNTRIRWSGPPIFLNQPVNLNSSFICTQDGRLLIEYNQNVSEIDWKTGAVRSLPALPLSPDGSSEINSIMQDKKGGLWFGRHGGVTIVKNGKTSFLPLGFKNDYIEDMAVDLNGKVWLCSPTTIWQVDVDADFSASVEVQKIYTSKNLSMRTICADQTGTIWLGTNGYGLVKYNPRVRDFSNFISGKSIWNIYEDQQGRIWTNISNKYFILNKKNDTPLPFYPRDNVGDYGVLEDRKHRFWVLRAFFLGHPGEFWLECYTPDLQMIDKTDFKANFNPNSVLLEDPAGNIWLGARKGELLRFNPDTKQFTTFDFSRLVPSFASELEVVAMVRETDGTFWIGTKHGLIRGTPAGETLQFSLFQNDPSNPGSLNNNSISSIFPDPSGNKIWVGTKGGGIGMLDKQSGQFRFFAQKNGLPNNVVYGILPDPAPDGMNLWLSTNRGLSRMSVKNDGRFVFKNYGMQNGLPGLEFNTSSYYRSSSGLLLFGGVEGLTVFDPKQLINTALPPKTVLTGLNVNNRELEVGDSTGILRTALERCDKIVLNWDENLLSIRFSALDFSASDQNRYRYRLSGVDPEWIESGQNNQANYSQLRPGAYLFEVLGSNSEGVWSEKPASLHIVIRPPWWQSWWAYSILILLICLSAYWFYRLKINRIQLENEILFEKKEVERRAALDAVKTNFFNNVTHEFRTPLTLILEPLRQLLKNPDDPDLKDKIRMAEKNSRSLLGLVNQLLDMARIESGNMTVDLRRSNFGTTVRLVFESFLHLAAQRGIKLVLSSEASLPSFEFDAAKVETVLNNLISNALKFTQPGGKVEIICAMDQGPWVVDHNGRAGAPAAIVRIMDNGSGIPADELPRVFERFYQVDGSHTRQGEGSGIGLALSRDLAVLMGGELSAESEPGKGSVFTLRIPTQGRIEPEKAHPAAMPENETPYPEPSAEHPVVLVIEDNIDLRQFIKMSVGERWQVAEASNGAEGVRKAMELLPDLVISDIMMPEKDGYAVCHELKNMELTAHIPVILLTAKSTVDARLKGLQTGADDYLTKPFHTGELLARMENLVRQRDQLRQHFLRHTPALSETAEQRLPEFLSAPDREFLRKFTLLIERQLSDESLGVEEFAQQMGVNRVQLHRKLRALSDQSPSEFVRTFRLERAMSMLKNREGNVTQVAGRVGFGNEKYFSTIFKEQFGVSPSEVW